MRLACWAAGRGRPLVFVPGWSSSGADLINVLCLIVDGKAMARCAQVDSPAFVNSTRFEKAVIHNDPQALARVLFDHAANDWRDVLRHKIVQPAGLITGEQSDNLPSQRWIQQQIPGSQLFVCSTAEQGDHFLMAKNPVKFTRDLREFLER